MVTIEQILGEKMPKLDEYTRSYVLSVLQDNGDDFTTVEDVYEAVGELVLGHCEDNQSEADVKELCNELLKVIICSHQQQTNRPLLMIRPSSSVELSSAGESAEEFSSIWIKQKDSGVKVDAKKLEKAEAKIKEKQDKRQLQQFSAPTLATSESAPNLATVNQSANRKTNKLDRSSTNSQADVRIENIDLSFSDKKLLIDANLILAFGRRYGLVGRNGIGKTTLMKAIATGQLRVPANIRVLHVEQEVAGDDTPVMQSVLESDTRREGLLAEEKRLNQQLAKGDETDQKTSHRLTEIYEELEHIGADKAPAEVAAVLYGLGFTPEEQHKPTREFSGGWRMRVALARALFLKPDLLLLDEPTNMLDMKAVYWLEDYLQTWPTTLLCVSHDRRFLNAIVTDIFHMHSKRLDPYKGDYDMFERVMTEKLKNQQKEFDALKLQREHTQKFIDRFRYSANRASSVQSKIKMLDKLPEIQAVERESEVTLSFPPCERVNPPVIQLDDINFHYAADRPIFQKMTLNADMDSRICIVGDNGSGKTTLLKILLGELSPVAGYQSINRHLRIGYFTQHHVDQLLMNITPVELLQQKFPGKAVEFYRGALGRFGITGDLGLQSISSLSGGQKSRLAFAILGLAQPNMLILDEPTNHLDIESVAALGKALNEFQGGVILVSHDEALIDGVCKELWVVKDRKVVRLEGGLKEYKALVRRELAMK